MVNPIPDKVKDCLGELTPAQQVILRGYIGTLRAELKEKEHEVLAMNDPDPNAHYHGEHKCTENQYVPLRCVASCERPLSVSKQRCCEMVVLIVFDSCQ